MDIGYWPHNVPRVQSLDSYREAYKRIGYEECDNEALEIGYQKVAIYVNSQNLPTHAARQLANGKWTSKLGQLYDVSHPFFDSWPDIILDGNLLTLSRSYGSLGALLRKKI